MEDEFYQAASNSWAVMGEYTESGKPMLANDFHMTCALALNFHDLQMTFTTLVSTLVHVNFMEF